ncbi:hypothetical protein BKA93DRAFT_746698 [Sparassis latifolia]
MSFKLGVFYLDYARTQRWYFTLVVNGTDTAEQLGKMINEHLKATTLSKLESVESRPRDFSGLNLREPLPDKWTLAACGIREGHSVLASTYCYPAITLGGNHSVGGPYISQSRIFRRRQSRHLLVKSADDSRTLGRAVPCYGEVIVPGTAVIEKVVTV